VRKLYDKHLLAAPVIAKIEEAQGPSDEVRNAALRFARRQEDHPRALFRAYSDKMNAVGLSKETYQLSLRYFEAISAQDPENLIKNCRVIGTCHFRLNEYGKALEEFKRFYKDLSLDTVKASSDQGVLAMIYYKLGKIKDAEAYFRKFQSSMPAKGWPNWHGDLKLYKEAKAMFASEPWGKAAPEPRVR